MSGRYNLKLFEAGQPLLEQLTAARMNALVDAINRSQVIFGDNVYGQRTPGGAIIRTRSAQSAAATDPDITFFLSDATTSEGDPPEVTNKVLVADGKINGAFPAGMGTDPYILDLADPADSLICAQVTFDADTQEILSRELMVFAAADFPDDEIVDGVGTFTLMIGFTFFDADDAFRIIMTRVGDINFELIDGAVNGVPGVIAIPALSRWMERPSDGWSVHSVSKRIAYLAGNRAIDNTMRLLSNGTSGTTSLRNALNTLNPTQYSGFYINRPLLLKLTREQYLILSWLVKKLTMSLSFSYTQSGGHGIYSATYTLDLVVRRSNYPPPRPGTLDPDEDTWDYPDDDPPLGLIDRHVDTEEQLVGHATAPRNFGDNPLGVMLAKPFFQARNAGIFLDDAQSTYYDQFTNLNGGIGDDNGDFFRFSIFDDWDPFCQYNEDDDQVLVPLGLNLSSGYGFGGLNLSVYDGTPPLGSVGDVTLDLGVGTIPAIKTQATGGPSGKTFSCDIEVSEWFDYTNTLGEPIWASGVRTGANPFK